MYYTQTLRELLKKYMMIIDQDIWWFKKWRWGLAGFQRVRLLWLLTCQCAACIIEEKTRSIVSFMRNQAARKTDRCVFLSGLVRDEIMCLVQDNELGEDLHSFWGYKHVNGYVKTPNFSIKLGNQWKNIHIYIFFTLHIFFTVLKLWMLPLLWISLQYQLSPVCS